MVSEKTKGGAAIGTETPRCDWDARIPTTSSWYLACAGGVRCGGFPLFGY